MARTAIGNPLWDFNRQLDTEKQASKWVLNHPEENYSVQFCYSNRNVLKLTPEFLIKVTLCYQVMGPVPSPTKNFKQMKANRCGRNLKFCGLVKILKKDSLEGQQNGMKIFLSSFSCFGSILLERRFGKCCLKNQKDAVQLEAICPILESLWLVCTGDQKIMEGRRCMQ